MGMGCGLWGKHGVFDDFFVWFMVDLFFLITFTVSLFPRISVLLELGLLAFRNTNTLAGCSPEHQTLVRTLFGLLFIDQLHII